MINSCKKKIIVFFSIILFYRLSTSWITIVVSKRTWTYLIKPNLTCPALSYPNLTSIWTAEIWWFDSSSFCFVFLSRSCYSTVAAIPICSSFILSGRRKRRGSIISDERPIAFGEDGNPVDFRAIIAASKVMVLFCNLC